MFLTETISSVVVLGFVILMLILFSLFIKDSIGYAVFKIMDKCEEKKALKRQEKQ